MRQAHLRKHVCHGCRHIQGSFSSMRQLQLGQSFRKPSAPRLTASIGLGEARLIVKSAAGPPGRLENELGLENGDGALDSVGNFLPKGLHERLPVLFSLLATKMQLPGWELGGGVGVELGGRGLWAAGVPWTQQPKHFWPTRFSCPTSPVRRGTWVVTTEHAADGFTPSPCTHTHLERGRVFQCSMPPSCGDIFILLPLTDDMWEHPGAFSRPVIRRMSLLHNGAV